MIAVVLGTSWVVTTASALFIVAGVLALIRLVRGPSLADRVIALDVSLVALMGALATRASDDATYLGVVAAIAIVGFTATVALSRFIETGARR